MEQHPSTGEPGDAPAGQFGGDYEYDEAHDLSAADMTSAAHETHRVEAPVHINADVGGDYGYDEAHDFGAS